ncbi:MAG: NAD-glutamate dehydrogenase [Alphaproteobacteria bacterium]|nr:NAD-glutamate dehydrogenase [Alphaproteobacteria bacterium]
MRQSQIGVPKHGGNTYIGGSRRTAGPPAARSATGISGDSPRQRSGACAACRPGRRERMSPMAPDTQQTELFEEIAAVARERMGGRDLEAALAFIALYYAGASPEDLTERLPDDLYGAAVAHLNLARRRAPGEAKVRVYNPEIEQHGWQSTHTIVEIVTDDLPFLVDSVRMVLNARGYTSHLVIHPVLRVRRGEDGRIEAVLPVEEAGGGETGVEAVVHIETDRQTERDVLDAIAAEMLAALGDVRVAVEDWGGMRERMRLAIEELDALPASVGGEEREEVKAFLEWIEDNHFTFLGYCESRVERACGAGRFAPEPDTGLGLLRGEGGPAPVPDLPGPGGMDAAELLAITRADRRSRVHRPSHLDCIALRRFDADGNVAGEHRFLGLYTSEAFNRAPRDIPLLRQKADALQRRAGYPPGSHAAKALQNIVDTFPRELLFQIPAGELFETATGILHLQERQRIRLFIHPDRFGRFYSCIVFVPRDRYNTRSRQVIQGILEEALGATDTEFTVRLSESVLARLFFVIRVEAGHAPQYDLADLERRLRVVSRTWTDDLHDALLDRFGEEAGTSLFRRYGEAFRADYREAYSARVAVLDVEKMERIL